MKKVICDYCGSRAKLVDSNVIYGRSYGKIYLCEKCGAYVGVHKGTDVPLGRLANAELRYWKMQAHAAFDPLWKYGKFKGFRKVAYGWLSDQLSLPPEKTHIGMFDVDQCKKVIEVCNAERRKPYGKCDNHK